MTRILLFLSALLLPALLFAENTRTFSMPGKDSIYYSHYEALRLIDTRLDKTNVGYIKTGGFNRKASLIPEAPLTELMSRYYAKAVCKGIKEHKELLIIVHDLQIEEPTTGEIGTVHIAFDCFGGDNEQYAFIGKCDSFFEMGSGIDISKNIERAATATIGGLIRRWSGTNIDAGAPRLTTEQAIKRREEANRKYPIYAMDSFKRGIYKTAADFLNGIAVDTMLIEVSDNQSADRHVNFYYDKKPGKRGTRLEPGDFYAIFDGRDWYLSHEKYATVMHFRGKEFYAELSMKGIANTTGGAMMFGIIGGLIAGSQRQHYECKLDPAMRLFRPVRRLK